MSETNEMLSTELVESLCKSVVVQKYIEKKYQADPMRTRLLLEIFSGFDIWEKEELLFQIYVYGSMLRREDWIERKLFLWLIDMAEKNF